MSSLGGHGWFGLTLLALVAAGCGGKASTADGGGVRRDGRGDGPAWPDYGLEDGRPPTGDGSQRADGGAVGDFKTPPPGTWVPVKAGTFNMGSPAAEPCRSTGETEHAVTLTRGFEIGATETTQGEFQAAMGYNPSNNAACGANCPVENLNWHQAAAYCNALSAKKSLGACYTCTGTQSAAKCQVDAAYAASGKTIYDCPGYRLPTEAEWEYACRAGATTALYNGALDGAKCKGDDANASAIAWYDVTAQGKTQPVGKKQPNALGLFDMSGNIQEWVHDVYQQDLGAGAATDPVIATAGKTQGVIRGGSAYHDPERLRCAFRVGQTFANAGTSLGVRCVRTTP